ncbi:MAG: hypothetical protein ACN6QH_20255 [Pseudomonas sp.]|uniref:hypothetical protein n=1 Tax=Pseudomonas sp. TaxID=306 RepID=UPI003D0A0830
MSSPEPRSPLTIIAIFAGIIEASALASLPFLDESSQSIYTWFLVGFPPFLTLLFFLTLNFNTKTLYGPDEYFTEHAETEDIPVFLSGKDSDSRTHVAHSLPHTSETSDSTVVISGANAQALIEVLASYAVQAPSASSLVLHNLEKGTRTTILTDSPKNHSPPVEQ